MNEQILHMLPIATSLKKLLTSFDVYDDDTQCTLELIIYFVIISFIAVSLFGFI